MVLQVAVRVVDKEGISHRDLWAIARFGPDDIDAGKGFGDVLNDRRFVRGSSPVSHVPIWCGKMTDTNDHIPLVT